MSYLTLLIVLFDIAERFTAFKPFGRKYLIDDLVFGFFTMNVKKKCVIIKNLEFHTANRASADLIKQLDGFVY